MSIPARYVEQWDELMTAVLAGEAGLVESIDKKTGEPIVVLCTLQRQMDSSIRVVPLARLFNGDPLDELQLKLPKDNDKLKGGR